MLFYELSLLLVTWNLLCIISGEVTCYMISDKATEVRFLVADEVGVVKH